MSGAAPKYRDPAWPVSLWLPANPLNQPVYFTRKSLINQLFGLFSAGFGASFSDLSRRLINHTPRDFVKPVGRQTRASKKYIETCRLRQVGHDLGDQFQAFDLFALACPRRVPVGQVIELATVERYARGLRKAGSECCALLLRGIRKARGRDQYKNGCETHVVFPYFLSGFSRRLNGPQEPRSKRILENRSSFMVYRRGFFPGAVL